ncbi:MAG: YegS/Rv2252/BmrU family lipid kinase [Bacteroidia bacterium]|nr:YegS/Rv2252/BmrU family lipid kinase [Bacteroidia bacterium]
MNLKKIAFIINPISGGIPKGTIPDLIEKYIDKKRFEASIFFTKSTEHNQELAKQCVADNYDVIIAVGGDGTINNTAKYVVNSDSVFGIIPLGSGNGLARHLNISLNPEKAIQQVNNFNVYAMDTGSINGHFFLNVVGVGFDAHVTDLFAKAPKRGFWQYTKITLSEFAKYKAMEYKMEIDGKVVVRNAFLICVANGSQYGNNAYISPLSIVNDGEFEVSVLKPFKILQAPMLGVKIFNKNIHTSALVNVFKGSHIKITRNDTGVVNVDGEPYDMGKEIEIKLYAKSLKIIGNEQ